MRRGADRRSGHLRDGASLLDGVAFSSTNAADDGNWLFALQQGGSSETYPQIFSTQPFADFADARGTRRATIPRLNPIETFARL